MLKKKIFSGFCLLLAFLCLLTACGSTSATADDLNNAAVTTNISTSATAPAGETLSSASATSDTPLPDGSTFEIHFIDVGQADAALILCDDQAMLIDGGNSEDSSLIYAYLKAHEVTNLDVMVATHGHADHVGGLSGSLNYATVGTAYSPVTTYDSKAFQNFTKYLDKQGVQITVPNSGDTFSLGSASVEILGPISPSDEPNNTSIVLRITYGNTRFLFTGDAETLEENEILDAGYDVSCDVLKVGHHGSNTSTGYRWLRESAPTYAVISVGTGNSYGHPTEATLSKLRDADVITYRTDMQGTIICTSDGTNITFQTEKNADADTLSGAGEGGNHTNESESGDTENVSQTSSGSSDATYIVNINSDKFHYPSCSSVDSMSEKNKLEVTSSRDELVADGYSPCGRCNP